MRRHLGLAVVAGLTSLVLAAPAQASARLDKTLYLRQDTPVTAAGFQNGACPGVPGDKDGWHFAISRRPDGVTFKSLTLTFDPGGTQTIAAGGSDAYAASELGAKLTKATAEVDGGALTLLTVVYIDLENTCPGQAPPPPAPAPAPVQEQAPAQPGPQQEQPQPAPQQPEQPPQQQPAPVVPGDQNEPQADPAQPGVKPTSAAPAATASPTGPALLSNGPDQPELELSGTDSSPVAARQDAEEPGSGLGIQGFALVATGVFLLLFGGVYFYVVRKRRSA